MDLLVLKLTITPLVIGVASLAARRWGPTIGGWLIALPLTSGPVVFFLALDHGTSFAASAAESSLEGCIPIAAFALAYALAAGGAGWPGALAAGAVAWALPAVLIEAGPDLPLPVVVVLVVAVVAITLRLLPRPSMVAPPVAAPAWDVPFRMIVVTSLVVLLTGAAQALGPRWSGLLATVPAIAGGLAVFSHHRDGPDHARGVLHGLIGGLLGTAAFHTMLSATLVAIGIASGFSAAIAAALVLQAAALRVLRRTPVEAVAETVDGLPAL